MVLPPLVPGYFWELSVGSSTCLCLVLKYLSARHSHLAYLSLNPNPVQLRKALGCLQLTSLGDDQVTSWSVYDKATPLGHERLMKT